MPPPTRAAHATFERLSRPRERGCVVQRDWIDTDTSAWAPRGDYRRCCARRFAALARLRSRGGAELPRSVAALDMAFGVRQDLVHPPIPLGRQATWRRL